MGGALVIVESPAKAKTIKKYLGKGFTVKASVGHVKDLPKSTLGVDIENNFAPTYKVISGKKKTVTELKKAAEGALHIYLALDPDREGEAIAWHVAEELSAKPRSKKKAATTIDKRIQRILFNEITKTAIQAAIKKPLALDKQLYEAQQARRILDRLVGYQISPLLWEKVRRGLSAGRVQSVAMRILCEREREIRAFKPEEYWTLHAALEGSLPPPFEANLVKIAEQKAALASEAETKALTARLQGKDFILRQVEKKDRKRHPAPPFITSTLQQEAARKLGFSAKRTMGTAQGLYEGVELTGEGAVGLITYMRTDSTRIADSAITQVRAYLSGKYAPDYLPEQPQFYQSKKGAQDAHEAIRPTNVDYTPENLKSQLSPDQYRLYDLIWKRFVASQMNSAILDQTALTIDAGDCEFRATGSVLRFPGFITIYQEGRDDSDDDLTKDALPDLKAGEVLRLEQLRPEQHFTEPPPRFSEASLIKEMEEKGIGRPSTYASIMSTIEDREYVRIDNKRFFVTDLGFIVTDLLVENFPNVMDVEFTARMESELDEVEEGKRTMVEALNDFYGPFSKNLEQAKENMTNIKRQEIPTDIECELCSKPTVIKWGRQGEFLACTGYPECRYTREFRRDEAGKIVLAKREMTGEFCAECGSQMIIRRGRFGKFLACSRYPDCKTTQSFKIGVSCPLCAANVVERRSRRGKVFYGCSAYPKCKFASWYRPVAEVCPDCKSPYLVEKHLKKTGSQVACPEKDCHYNRPLESKGSAA